MNVNMLTSNCLLSFIVVWIDGLIKCGIRVREKIENVENDNQQESKNINYIISLGCTLKCSEVTDRPMVLPWV